MSKTIGLTFPETKPSKEKKDEKAKIQLTKKNNNDLEVWRNAKGIFDL